ncbi:unnamed protein product [Allacma fusca]|uniref:Uncharacterized protein n=1 Tax=Allacma fusca TaxID=39272 RepID=A0A8J2JXI2_9HEXA|nr:unnamed protein product [Allacma fusca]
MLEFILKLGHKYTESVYFSNRKNHGHLETAEILLAYRNCREIQLQIQLTNLGFKEHVFAWKIYCLLLVTWCISVGTLLFDYSTSRVQKNHYCKF